MGGLVAEAECHLPLPGGGLHRQQRTFMSFAHRVVRSGDQTEVIEPSPVSEPYPPTPASSPADVPAASALWDHLRTTPLGDVAALVALLLVTGFLWGRARTMWYWIDEGMTIGIASHPLGSIPELMRQDGSPPLYYLVLHVWTSVFGSSEAQTHVLSTLFALAAIPAGLWVGWSLLGRRTGWILAVLMAVSPFLARYAAETRMYSLVVLLAMLAFGCFLHGFVFRRRRYVPAFVVLLTLLLYTHNWGLFFALGASVAMVPCFAFSSDRRRFFLDAALAAAAIAMLYAPWVSTLLYQRAHTGAPWATRPTLEDMRDEIALLLGGEAAVVALALGAGVALGAMLRRPWNRVALVVAAAAVVPAVIVAGGWVVSRGSSVWAARYLAVAVPPIAVLTAAAIARGGQTALAALGVVIFLSAPIGVKGPPYQKSNLKAVAEAAGPAMGVGDLVVADYGTVPLLAHYLPPGPRYTTTTGPVADERVADQRDGVKRLAESQALAGLRPLLDAVPTGGHVLVACPSTNPFFSEQTEFADLIELRCAELRASVQGDARFRLDKSWFPPQGVKYSPVDGLLFTKQSAR